MPGFERDSMLTSVTSGLPYAPVFAASRSAMPSTPCLPSSRASATRSSTPSVSSRVFARASCMNASTDSSYLSRAFACAVYAERPFTPYVTSSRRLRTSSSSHDSTPTVAAFAAKSASSPHQSAASESPSASPRHARSDAFTLSVRAMRSRMAASSKFALVMVQNMFVATRPFTPRETGSPFARSALVTADRPLVT